MSIKSFIFYTSNYFRDCTKNTDFVPMFILLQFVAPIVQHPGEFKGLTFKRNYTVKFLLRSIIISLKT